MNSASTASEPSTTSMAKRAIFVVGIVLQTLIAYPMAALGLVAPVWAVVGLLTVWALLVVVAIQQRNKRPWFALVAPVATVGVAWAVVAAGGAFLGWQA